MIRWFSETAPLRRKFDIALGAVVLPMALTWGFTGFEYMRLAGTARTEVASSYMQMLRFGMEATLGASTVAMLASLAIALWLRGRLVRPVTEAVDALDDLAAGDLTEPSPRSPRRDEAGRIVAATAILRQGALAAHRAAQDHAARETAAAAERERVMSALAEGLGALAASNRQLRGGEPPRPARPALEAVPTLSFPGPAPDRARPQDEEPADDGLVDLLRRLDHRRAGDSGLRLVAI